MDDVLEYAGELITQFDKAVKKYMSMSAARKADWQNPSDKMIIAQLLKVEALNEGGRKWREEHPEEWRDTMKKAQAAAQPALPNAAYIWREENPEAVRAHLEAAWVASRRWREENPEAVLATFISGLNKWMEEHPEEMRAAREKWRAACDKWKKEHPEEMRANLKKGTVAALKWREENPEEARAIQEKASDAGEKWREKNPEKVRARQKKGMALCHTPVIQEKSQITRRLRSAQKYSKWLEMIKPRITEAGMRIEMLLKLAHQWNYNQTRNLLQRAIEQGDLVRVAVNPANVRYCLPSEAKAA